jgi:alpha-beta hydrolase superfamily lysophospholipase
MYQEQKPAATQDYNFTARDGKVYLGRLWYPQDQEAQQWLVALHGLFDHGARFEDLAQHLTGRGFGVYAPDLRGHGLTDPPESPLRGLLAPENGWQVVAQDLSQGLEEFRQEKKITKLFLLGQNLGAMILLEILKNQNLHKHLGGVLLIGPRPALDFGEGLALAGDRGTLKREGPHYYQEKKNRSYLEKLNRPFHPLTNQFSWFNRDQRVTTSIQEDPLHLDDYPVGFWVEMGEGILKLYKNQSSNDLSEIPLCILGGELDTFAGGLPGLRGVIKQLQKWNFHSIASKSYPDTRADIIHELNRREVFRDIHRWFEARRD